MKNSHVKITVLVVDDQFVFREIHKKRITAYLEDRIEYEILTANGLEEALELAKTRLFDVVFTDMQMDDKRDCGLILTRKIKALNPNTQVFIVSNADLECVEENAEAAGATGCFQMPLNKADLEAVFRMKLSVI